jgi:hypothetical protein
MVSKIKDIGKKLPKARSATKAEIARKLAAGLPIASMKDGEMVVEQLVEVAAPQFVAKPVPASSIAVTTVKPALRVARVGTGTGTISAKPGRKSASAV